MYSEVVRGEFSIVMARVHQKKKLLEIVNRGPVEELMGVGVGGGFRWGGEMCVRYIFDF